MGEIIYIPESLAPGAPGGGWTFEYVNRNLEGYNYTLTYDGNDIDTKVYDLGSGSTITLTYTYTGNNVTSMVFSGDTPFGLPLTKTLTYTGNKLIGVSYS